MSLLTRVTTTHRTHSTANPGAKSSSNPFPSQPTLSNQIQWSPSLDELLALLYSVPFREVEGIVLDWIRVKRKFGNGKGKGKEQFGSARFEGLSRVEIGKEVDELRSKLPSHFGPPIVAALASATLPEHPVEDAVTVSSSHSKILSFFQTMWKSFGDRNVKEVILTKGETAKIEEIVWQYFERKAHKSQSSTLSSFTAAVDTLASLQAELNGMTAIQRTVHVLRYKNGLLPPSEMLTYLVSPRTKPEFAEEVLVAYTKRMLMYKGERSMSKELDKMEAEILQNKTPNSSNTSNGKQTSPQPLPPWIENLFVSVRLLTDLNRDILMQSKGAREIALSLGAPSASGILDPEDISASPSNLSRRSTLMGHSLSGSSSTSSGTSGTFPLRTLAKYIARHPTFNQENRSNFLLTGLKEYLRFIKTDGGFWTCGGVHSLAICEKEVLEAQLDWIEREFIWADGLIQSIRSEWGLEPSLYFTVAAASSSQAGGEWEELPPELEVEEFLKTQQQQLTLELPTPAALSDAPASLQLLFSALVTFDPKLTTESEIMWSYIENEREKVLMSGQEWKGWEVKRRLELLSRCLVSELGDEKRWKKIIGQTIELAALNRQPTSIEPIASSSSSPLLYPPSTTQPLSPERITPAPPAVNGFHHRSSLPEEYPSPPITLQRRQTFHVVNDTPSRQNSPPNPPQPTPLTSRPLPTVPTNISLSGAIPFPSNPNFYQYQSHTDFEEDATSPSPVDSADESQDPFADPEFPISLSNPPSRPPTPPSILQESFEELQIENVSAEHVQDVLLRFIERQQVRFGDRWREEGTVKAELNKLESMVQNPNLATSFARIRSVTLLSTPAPPSATLSPPALERRPASFPTTTDPTRPSLRETQSEQVWAHETDEFPGGGEVLPPYEAVA